MTSRAASAPSSPRRVADFGGKLPKIALLPQPGPSRPIQRRIGIGVGTCLPQLAPSTSRCAAVLATAAADFGGKVLKIAFSPSAWSLCLNFARNRDLCPHLPTSAPSVGPEASSPPWFVLYGRGRVPELAEKAGASARPGGRAAASRRACARADPRTACARAAPASPQSSRW